MTQDLPSTSDQAACGLVPSGRGPAPYRARETIIRMVAFHCDRRAVLAKGGSPPLRI